MEKYLRKFAIIIALAIVSSAASAFAQSQLTIEEYTDFECPYCARGANLMKQAAKEYGGKIKIVYRNFPLPFHPHAMVAAKAFTAVREQNPSLASTFQSELFSHQEELVSKGEVYLYDLADQLGIDVDKMKVDMNSPAVAKTIDDDIAAAKAHEITGTPSFMIGTEKVVGAMPYNDIKKVIERQLGH